MEGHSLQSDPRDGLLTRRSGVESVVWDVGLSLGWCACPAKRAWDVLSNG